MVDVAKGFTQVADEVQPQFLKNMTDTDFYTNDNPIIYFPANEAPNNCRPYRFRNNAAFEFLFPITNKICMYHGGEITSKNAKLEPILSECHDVGLVRRINSFVAAFADRYVVRDNEIPSSEYPALNRCPRPVVHRIPSHRGQLIVFQFEMGEPLKLPKWEASFSRVGETPSLDQS